MSWTWLFFTVCGLFVAAGAWLVVRDLAGPRQVPRRGSVSTPAAPGAGDVSGDAAVTIRPGVRPAAPPRSTAVALKPEPETDDGSFDRVLTTIATIRAGDDAPLPAAETSRVADLPERYHAVDAALAAAVTHANAAFASIALSIGEAGEAGWSFANRGYGTFRRVSIGERSVGWLRLEATSAGTLAMTLRSHDADQVLLNAQTRTPLHGLTSETALNALALALEPAAKLAAWRATQAPTAPEAVASTPPVAPPVALSPPDPSSSAATPTERTDVADVVAIALARAADSIAPRRCALTPSTPPTFDPATGGQRRRCVLARDGRVIATLDLVTTQRDVDIAVAAFDRTRSGLDRRHRLDAPSIDALAEAILACLAPVMTE